jgi:hypothetical protein
MTITFAQTTTPPGKLADAELHFHDGPLAGLKLIGFAVWERRTGSGRNVTFPARIGHAKDRHAAPLPGSSRRPWVGSVSRGVRA